MVHVISFREDEAREGRTGLGYELMGSRRKAGKNPMWASRRPTVIVEGLRHMTNRPIYKFVGRILYLRKI
jgi:hypothetical protein